MFDPFLTEKQILRKLGGDKIPSKVFTYDGNAEETQEIGGITYAKIADTAPDLHNVTKAVYTAPNGSTIEYSSEKLTVEDLGSGQIIKASLGSTTGTVIILDQSGLWVYAQPGFGYCSYVEFAETIVPIDQKYLPGVCLPVVELSTTFSVNTYLTDAEGKALDVAFEANTPIIIKCNIDLGTNAVFNNTAAVWSPVIDNNANVFIASFGGVTLTIVNPHGYPAWGCSIMQTEV